MVFASTSAPEDASETPVTKSTPTTTESLPAGILRYAHRLRFMTTTAAEMATLDVRPALGRAPGHRALRCHDTTQAETAWKMLLHCLYSLPHSHLQLCTRVKEAEIELETRHLACEGTSILGCIFTLNEWRLSLI